MSEFHHFLRLTNIPLHTHMTPFKYIHILIDKERFHLWVTVNNTAMTRALTSVWVPASINFVDIPKSGIAGSHGNTV